MNFKGSVVWLTAIVSLNLGLAVRESGAVPVRPPSPGTAEYCYWQQSQCEAKANYDYAACLVSDGKPTAAESYCIRTSLIALLGFGIIEGPLFGLSPDEFETQLGYSLAECIAAYEYSGSEQSRPIDTSPEHVAACGLQRYKQITLCRQTAQRCLLELGGPTSGTPHL